MAVTIIGDAFIDITVPIGDIKRGETHYDTIGIFCRGVANVAVQISRLGEQASFVGRVGNDALGSVFVENLNKHNVKLMVSRDNEHSTGLCVSLVYEDGERSMIADRGANDFLSREEIDAHLEQIVKSTVTYFSGYSLLNNSDTVLYAMRKCRENAEVWFNPGAPNIITNSFKQIVNELVDVLIMNLDEARAITGNNNIDEVMASLPRMVGLSIVTLGEKGCIIAGAKQRFDVPWDTVVQGVDTTGAGDAFSAGFIVARLRGMDEVGCAKLGHQTAMSFMKGSII